LSHEHDHHGPDHHHHGFGHVHVVGSGLKFAFYLNLAIVLIEIVGGLKANSLALLGDAGHNAADVFAVGLAWYAQSQASKPSSARMTFGHYRAGILVALANGLSLIGIAGILSWEAYHRIVQPQPVVMIPLFVTGALGLAFNAYAAFGLKGDKDINVRSAFLHLLGDAAASGGVILGGLVILFTGWHWVDPVLSVAIAVLIAVGAWDVVKKATRILMEGTPEQVNPAKVVSAILAMDGVEAVHDVHLWSMDVERNALSCHIVVDGQRTVGEMRPFLGEVSRLLKEQFGIGHTTIQLECQQHGHAGDACGLPLGKADHNGDVS
jgi:cobalt-zinc-cadmium efflux system protein